MHLPLELPCNVTECTAGHYTMKSCLETHAMGLQQFEPFMVVVQSTILPWWQCNPPSFHMPSPHGNLQIITTWLASGSQPGGGKGSNCSVRVHC